VIAQLLHPRSGTRLPQASLWLALAAAILAIEGIALTSTFDTGLIMESSSVWARLLVHSTVVFPAGIAVAAAWMVTSGSSLWRELRDLIPQSGSRRSCFGVHCLSTAIFAALTGYLFRVGPADSLGTWLLILLWLGSGLTACLSILSTAVPVRALFATASRNSRTLATGVVVGLAAYSAGSSGDAPLWELLSELTLYSVAELLGTVTTEISIALEQMAIGTDGFAVQIGAGCSGYEGMGLMWVFTCVHLWLRRDELRFPHAFLLLPIATLLSFGANVLRIATLILIGDKLSPEIARGAFHSHAGWVLFCALAIGLAAVADRIPGLQREQRTRVDSSKARPDQLLPFVVFLGAGLLLATVVENPVEVEWMRFAPVLLALWAYRSRYRSLTFKPSAFSVSAGCAVFAIWTGMAWLLSEPLVAPDHIAQLSGPTSVSSISWLAVRFVGSVMIVPMVEELAFRGCLVDRLGGSRGRLALFACLGSSLLFGLAHDQWLAGVLAGAIFFAVRARHGLGQAILAHALSNALLFALLLYSS